jgi:S1-C subfamily serine protease
MIARVSLTGYATHEIALTEGPMQWIDLHGRNHGQYWLFKSDHFEVQLDPVGSTFTGAVSATLTPETVALRPELSLEEIVRRTKPAVVYLKALDKSGTGFFATDTGVLATNAHVARGDSSFAAVLAGNPGDAMLFSVTKGIVSAVGKFSAAGPGTWIQTDAPINPGNSGGRC